GLNFSAFSSIHFSILIGDCTLLIDMSVFLRVQSVKLRYRPQNRIGRSFFAYLDVPASASGF
ncbi:MAG: hypothetical protein ACXWF1_07420, partial [Chthoniobacterales bacterium]